MSLISVNHLTFYYDGSYDNIFENVSFQIDSRWKLGLVGRNGRGKTTFLNLLMGKYEYKGNISSSVVFDYFPFPVEDRKRDTIEIIEEVEPEYELWRICRELTILSVDCEVLYRPFETLSNGEQTKVLLAVLFARENHFLLIDEPTNHLDMETRETVMRYLREKNGFIFVSHDRYFLDGCVDHIMSVNKANIEVVQGNFSTWWENKRRQDEYELAENERLKQEVQRLSRAAQEKEKWSHAAEKTKYKAKSGSTDINRGFVDKGYIGHKAAKMMKRSIAASKRAQEAAREKKGLLKNIEQAEPLKLCPLAHHRPVLAEFEDVSIFYRQGEKEKNVISHLDLKVGQGERIVLYGRNGCGKSSVLKLILNQLNCGNNDGEAGQENPGYHGKITLANGLAVSYVPQDTSWLFGTLQEFISACGLKENLFLTLLRKLDFSRVQFDKRMEDYSEGQKKKVLIAKSLCEQVHLYIWDEPLNFIDIFSRIQIAELLKEHKPTMILVEHDKRFVEDVATEVVQL